MIARTLSNVYIIPGISIEGNQGGVHVDFMLNHTSDRVKKVNDVHTESSTAPRVLNSPSKISFWFISSNSSSFVGKALLPRPLELEGLVTVGEWMSIGFPMKIFCN